MGTLWRKVILETATATSNAETKMTAGSMFMVESLRQDVAIEMNNERLTTNRSIQTMSQKINQVNEKVKVFDVQLNEFNTQCNQNMSVLQNKMLQVETKWSNQTNQMNETLLSAISTVQLNTMHYTKKLIQNE